jgi:Flp pilus assembly protein TadD
MGEVWRGHDCVLDREVAIKVLRRRLGGDEAARQFREEAALVARLQHPSVVPVHDCGELADGRPFFVMKLIEGRTLAELLREWPATAERLPHYLQLFGQVCQAVAFAHAHTPPALHRDLKPSNVMVGSFGEVQVMDWGLAKLLTVPPAPRPQAADGAPLPPGPAAAGAGEAAATEPYHGGGPETLTGVAKGTPQFMAPEQARGERAAIGPATDVFGLGGILCVLLTGQPPYPGGASRRVATADLAEPFARLEKCGADEELVALAKRCLAPAPAERLPDAAAVAQEVAAYQSGVQERLRQAELRRAAAEVEARAERKRRRLQLVLVGAVLALVLGVGFVIWRDQQQLAAARAKQHDADQAARAELDRARKALQQAQAQPLKEFAKYDEARTAARAAGEVARGGSEEVRREAAAVLREVTRAGEQGARNKDLLTAWLDVYPTEKLAHRPDGSGRVVTLALPSPDRQFGAALEKWGLDIDRVSAAEAVARLQSLPKPVLEEVVAGLDSWAEERQKAGRLERAWRKLAEVADRLDPNDLRRELRRLRLDSAWRRKGLAPGRWLPPAAELAVAAQAQARRRLQSLARRVAPATEAVLTVLALAKALEAAGSPAEAEAVLYKALVARPDEVVLRDAMGRLLERQGPAHYARAASAFEAARAVRPELGLRLIYVLTIAGRAQDAEAVARDLLRRRPGAPEAHLGLGWTLYSQQQFKEAEAACRQAIKIEHDFPAAHGTLGQALAGQRRYKEAEAAFRQALQLQPDLPEAHDNLGNALAERGRHKEAEAAYRQALKLQPGSPEAHSNLSNALRGQGRYQEAEAACRQALQLKPDLPDAHSNLGAALYEQGREKEAEAAYRQALKLQPGFPWALSNLGAVLIAQGRFQEAEAACRQALKLQPDFPGAHDTLGTALLAQQRFKEAEAACRQAIKLEPDYHGAHNNLGNVLNAQVRYQEAEAACRQALQLKPDLPQAHDNLGTALTGQRRFQEAEAAHRQAIKLKPDYPPAHNNLGTALSSQGRYREAEAACRKALQLKPKFPEAHSNLGNALSGQRRYQEAEAADRQAIKLKPDFPEAHDNLGTALRAQGRYQEAEAAHRQAIKLKPDSYLARSNLGIALGRLGRYQEAEAACRQAIKLNPDYPVAYTNLGTALAAHGRYKEAEAAFRQTLKLEPDSPVAHSNLGAALVAQGQYKEAEAAFRKAIALQPADARSRNALGELQRLLTLEQLLPAALAGPLQSRPPEELLRLAGHCGSSGQRYLAAVGLYRAAFAAAPKAEHDLGKGHRYLAACAAALAAVSQGKDASPLAPEEALWLSQRARAWLRADLAACTALATKADPKLTYFVRQRLEHWQSCDALAGVREPKCLACFPEDERRAWVALWAEVDALLKRAAGR